ncbi:uncharacterized protein BCR38DRAFT_413485 [Pseudomassariella vexata]|uniref:ATPase AAA-type core domain-containing protein n=1 Tax=Pseudomassariella vexata TaxID=1141098 RepID=A0A1Y2DFL4_9PEZI|nr:uncharacterized protein BCR38DRAFT_413485 [Pseudomassariella vexata]ORY58072.1 hypothetical protein BCR38DRAFT_413485 [Pseudomassariella vexata]
MCCNLIKLGASSKIPKRKKKTKGGRLTPGSPKCESKRIRLDPNLPLSKAHTSDEASFDGMVQGKGKCLEGLLNGPPETGKTATAEIEAEASNWPLYVVTTNELDPYAQD